MINLTMKWYKVNLVITHIAKIQIFFKKIMLKSTKIIIFKEII